MIGPDVRNAEAAILAWQVCDPRPLGGRPRGPSSAIVQHGELSAVASEPMGLTCSLSGYGGNTRGTLMLIFRDESETRISPSP
jgi:hypothetical protein